MEYRPSKLPANISEDAQSLAAYLEDELQRISSSLIENIIALDLSPAHAVPLRPRTGMIVYADGTDWNPGSGEGIYTFGADAAWHYLYGVLPIGSSSTFGLVKVDNSTIIATAGVISATIASKADQIAASSLVLETTPGRQQFHPSAAKAWVKFTGSAINGNQTLGDSFNITSVARTGLGTYTVTFTTAFTTANYCCLGSSHASGSTNGYVQFGSLAAGSVVAQFVNITGPTSFDPTLGGTLVFFGTE